MELISIVVPIYKVEKYINKCIDSIINQTYKNIEIILVDDGSEDVCSEICDEYASKDNRIRVIHKINGGLSSARNIGIDKASGMYIAFVDSDDYISERMIEILYENIKKYNADISICDFEYVNEKGQKLDIKYENKICKGCINGKEIINKSYLLKNGAYWVVAWNKLYKTELFKGIRYPEGKIHEDEFIIHKLIYNATKIICDDYKGYYYVQRPGSIMYNGITYKSFDKVEAYFDRGRYLIENNMNEAAYHVLCAGIEMAYEIRELNKSNSDFKYRYKKLRKQYINLCKKIKNISFKQKIILALEVINLETVKKLRSVKTDKEKVKEC